MTIKPRHHWLLIVASLSCMYFGALREHLRFGMYPLIFNDDSRQYTWTFVMDRQKDPPPDVLYEYRRATMPIGYKALYAAAAKLGDPRVFSKISPYLLLLSLILLTGYCAYCLAGPAAAWGSTALILSSSIFLERMAGAHPRAFAYPLMAAMLAALISGRPKFLALWTVLSAAFYPVTAVIGASALTSWMCLSPLERGDASQWSVQTRWRLLLITAALCIGILLPTILATNRFSPQMRVSDLASYPEYGRDGRYRGEADRPPFGEFWRGAAESLRLGLEAPVRPWHLPLRRYGDIHNSRLRLLLFLLVAAGLAVLAKQDARLRRILYLPALILMLHTLSKTFAPSLYLPERYLIYVFPLLGVLLVPVALSALPLYFTKLKKTSWARPCATVFLCSLHLLFFGGRGSHQAGYQIQINKSEWIYPFIATLPPSSVIAGWPGPHAVIDNVPYLTGRTAFLTFENHEAYYKGYADEMRRRTRALIAAYYATDSAPLRRLREEYGVTHIIADPKHFKDRPATYFRPFNLSVREEFDRARTSGKTFEILKQKDRIKIYDDSRHFVLDLSKI